MCKTHLLPNAWFTIALLAGMKPQDRARVMAPNVTQAQVKK